MKKILALLLCLFTVLPLFACTVQPPAEEEKETDDGMSVSKEEALEIASSYWSLQSGDIDEDTESHYLLMHVEDTLAEPDYYHVIRLSWVLNGARPSESKELLIHKRTGDTVIPTSDSVFTFEAHYAVVLTAAGYTYFIFDENKQTLHTATTDRQPNLWMVNDATVCISIDMGEGNRQYQIYDLKNDRLSEAFDYAVEVSEGLVAYLDGELDNRFLVVRSIFDDTAFYKEYRLEFAETAMPVNSAHIFGGNLYLSYDLKGDGESSTLIPILETACDHFADYNAILRLVNGILTAIPCFDDHVDYSDAFRITDEKQTEWFNNLFTSLMAFYPVQDEEGVRSEYREAIGYAIKDLNGDGVYELVLLRNDYEIIAIFTMVEGKPILLDHYWNRYKCFIDENGLIYTMGSNGADSNRKTLYRIAGGTGELEMIANFGLDGQEWVNGVAVQLYFKNINGEDVRISKVEYDSLMEEYWGILGSRTSAEYTRDFSRIYFTVVPHKYESFSPIAVFDNYEGVISDATPMEEAELAQLKTQPVIAMYRELIKSYQISSEEHYAKTTHFALADVDGNGILDLLLRTTDLIFVVSYEDLAEKKLHLDLLDDADCVLLEDGTVFSCLHNLSSDSLSVSIRRMNDSEVSCAYRIDRSDAYYYCPNGSTKELWLEDLRGRNLKRMYWYEFNDENIQKYLPCDTPLPFTYLNFSTYDSLLNVICHLTDSYNLRKIEPYYEGKFEILFDCSTQENYEKYLFIKNLVYWMYPKALGASSPAENAIGYAIKDLNNDGVEELMLFNGENYWLDAVFTLVDGVPTYDTTDYGFEKLHYDQQLEYWEKTVGIDVLPLFSESENFDFPKTEETDGK